MSGAPTEKPTPKRLRDARRRGEVASSRELTSSVALAAGIATLVLCGGTMTATLARALEAALLRSSSADAPTPAAALADALALLGRVAVAPLAAAAAGAVVAAVLQVGPLWSPRALRPRGERVDPAAGLRRIFSGAQLASVALGLCKVVVIAATAWHLAGDVMVASRLAAAPGAVALAGAAPIAARFSLIIAALLVAMGALDLVLARRRHQRGLRMSRDEVRREQKDEDGDPQHKAERRRAHRALAAAVPLARATCVVVNPTHVAVALHHEAASDGAPIVVAKGSGDEARRIRAEARRASVPIVQDVPLARALFRLAEVGDEIPEELYQAAAAVLVHVHALPTEKTP